jgi:hypothetical protein
MEHIITLQSNVHSNQTTNSIASFVTPLSQRLKLEGNWVVGISEIQYKKSWYNVLQTNKIALIDELGNIFDEEGKINNETILNNAKEVYISEGHYQSEEHLINTLNDELKKFEGIEPPTIEYNNLSKKICIKPGIANKGIKLYPTFGDEIDYMIGLKTEINNTYAYSIDSNKLENDITIFKNNIKDFRIEPFHPVEITRGYHSLYIYSNIVYPSHIGDTFSQILRVVEVPNEKNFGDDVVIRYENPQYRNVLFGEISNIEINIKDDSNEFIPFKFGRVRIDLHFKKI